MVIRRRLSIFSLAFLDVMSCGFGAVILVFLIINHETMEQQESSSEEVLTSNRQLDYQIQLEKEKLKEIESILQSLKNESSQIEIEIDEASLVINSTMSELEETERESIVDQQTLEALRSDIESRDQEVKRLRAETDANQSTRIRSFEGDGDRQYLTGLRIAGKNIVIALDTSTSMLDETIVNVLIRRNKDQQAIKQAPKWQRSIRTVEWIGAQLPLDSKFQVYGFNEDAQSFLPTSDASWVSMEDGAQLNQAIEAIKETVPQGGTSLENLIQKIASLSPLPDNVYLITDGLPTLSDRPARSALVSGRKRIEYFRDAISRLPKQIPINVILFPMEGDPMAAAEFWNLARITNGAFISPSRDWP